LIGFVDNTKTAGLLLGNKIESVAGIVAYGFYFPFAVELIVKKYLPIGKRGIVYTLCRLRL